jgi:hypothetical protein
MSMRVYDAFHTIADSTYRNTPAVTGPLCKPIRIDKLLVSAPRDSSNDFVTLVMWFKQSCAKRTITIAWRLFGLGRPKSAEDDGKVRIRRDLWLALDCITVQIDLPVTAT